MGGGAATIDGRQPTPRQREVLDAALALLVASDEALTMTAVARKASCSKETLYKWFGDRDGLLTATVQWQAAKVHPPEYDSRTLDRAQLAEALERFAADWLTTLSGETSVALNRLAVGHSGTERRDLGAIVLENGPFAMRERLRGLLQAGRAGHLLRFSDADATFSTFFGLVVRDRQIRLLLGDRLEPAPDEIRRDAAEATRQFLVLFGTSQPAADGRR